MRIEQKIIDDDRAWLIERPEFQRLLFEILSRSGIYQRTREEPNVLFNEGKRSLGLEILSLFSSTPGEPHDTIMLALEAGMKLKQGANDERRIHNHDRDDRAE